jgi:hypothetical protein
VRRVACLRIWMIVAAIAVAVFGFAGGTTHRAVGEHCAGRSRDRDWPGYPSPMAATRKGEETGKIFSLGSTGSLNPLLIDRWPRRPTSQRGRGLPGRGGGREDNGSGGERSGGGAARRGRWCRQRAVSLHAGPKYGRRYQRTGRLQPPRRSA